MPGTVLGTGNSIINKKHIILPSWHSKPNGEEGKRTDQATTMEGHVPRMVTGKDTL